MKPTTQTRTGSDGNCFAACLASILDTELPEFGIDVPEEIFWKNVDAWLASRGYTYKQVPYDPANPPEGWSTIEGTSPRGGQHACVAYNGELVWDPHPLDGSRHGLVEPKVWGLLLPLKAKARDGALSGASLREALTPVYLRHDEIKATSPRNTNEVASLVKEAKQLLSSSRISDKRKWMARIDKASAAVEQARNAERSGDVSRAINNKEYALAAAHHVLTGLRALSQRTTKAKATDGVGTTSLSLLLAALVAWYISDRAKRKERATAYGEVKR